MKTTNTSARERPILFSAPMVRAILNGTKTQTRRLVKLNMAGRVQRGAAKQWHIADPDAVAACPYGQPGDRLWVRETFIASRGYDELPPTKFGNKPLWYVADGEPDKARWWHLSDRRRPAIHMPRWACRIVLEVTGVRVERLQGISDADAGAEGVDRTNTSVAGYARERFRRLWASTGGDWDANPWVWAVEFKRLDTSARRGEG
ncbi:hypothetical protein [Lysobacter antibioticus]|uniref:ASCH domain-containing protein n=1 Tax=Lysobacter antibioticus TaxID=84531 RepID=A0A0S2F7E1_LYSAN|nr:hypothetical protein [Lysobacter antibioticus]ALN79462.1 hypothetical protein LA76x_1305 [Lysobacter antibioticus]